MRTAMGVLFARKARGDATTEADRESVLLLRDPARFAHAFTGILLGLGAQGPATPEPCDGNEQSLLDRLHRRIVTGQAAASLPGLPAIVPLLLGERLRSNEALEQLVTVIERDRALARRVLDLANSPAFVGTRSDVGSIGEAALFVGEDGLRALLMAAVVQPHFSLRLLPFEAAGEALWQHALDCARACRSLAADSGEDPTQAFILGLMHDVGKAMVLRLALGLAGRECRSLRPALLQDVVTRYGPQVTLTACDRWGLPVAFKGTLRQYAVADPALMSPLAQVLHGAEALAEVHLVLGRRLASRHEAMAHLKARGVPWANLLRVFPEDRHPSSEPIAF